VADPSIALHLSGLRPTKYDNIVASSTALGNKTTVAAGCIIGENGVIGDKSSIKRSVLGNGCRLGQNAKVINSVLLDNVIVGDNCLIQNSILSSGVQLKERSSVKDCQVGPGYTIAAGVEYKGEVLAKGAK
jgi:translation initiation factor eIF-2B subunit gamma